MGILLKSVPLRSRKEIRRYKNDESTVADFVAELVEEAEVHKTEIEKRSYKLGEQVMDKFYKVQDRGMKFFLKKRVGKDSGKAVQLRDDDDYTVADFFTDFEGHKEDLQEWKGQIVRSFSRCEDYRGQIHQSRSFNAVHQSRSFNAVHQSRSFNAVHRGMSEKRSDDRTTQEEKALYRLRQKLMKKKNLQKKKQRQLKTEILRTNSNLNSKLERGENRRATSFGRTRSDSFLGEYVKGRTMVVYNKSREGRNPESLPKQIAFEQRDSWDSSLLEEPSYCGILEDTLGDLGDTLEEYHNMEAERLQRRKQMLKVTSKVEKVKKKKKKNFKVYVHNGLK